MNKIISLVVLCCVVSSLGAPTPRPEAINNGVQSKKVQTPGSLFWSGDSDYEYNALPCEVSNSSGVVYTSECPSGSTCSGGNLIITIASVEYDFTFCDVEYEPWLAWLPCEIESDWISYSRDCDVGVACAAELEITWGDMLLGTVTFCGDTLPTVPDFGSISLDYACSATDDTNTVVRNTPCPSGYSCDLGPITLDVDGQTYQATYCLPDSSTPDMADPVSYMDVFKGPQGTGGTGTDGTNGGTDTGGTGTGGTGTGGTGKNKGGNKKGKGRK